MKIYSYQKSQALLKRLAMVIPGGSSGYWGALPAAPVSGYPFYISKARDARFWDVDGNEFIDYTCGCGSLILGYNNPVVEAAADMQRDKAGVAAVPAEVMVRLAEELVNTVTGADWAFFAKNENEIVALSLRVARAKTGRKKIIRLHSGGGISFLSPSPVCPGMEEDDTENMLPVKWNYFEMLEDFVKKYPDRIAGMIVSPYHYPASEGRVLPMEGYWKKVENLCRREGIVLILDDIRTAFRFDVRGSHEYFGFHPDMIVFGRAMGNGYPVSAMVGTREMKEAASEVLPGGGECFSAVPLAAALAVIQELKENNVPAMLAEKGEKLTSGLQKTARETGFHLMVSGHPAMPILRLKGDPSMKLYQNWCGQCARRGACFPLYYNGFVSAALTEEDMRKTFEIARDAFKAIHINTPKNRFFLHQKSSDSVTL